MILIKSHRWKNKLTFLTYGNYEKALTYLIHTNMTTRSLKQRIFLLIIVLIFCLIGAYYFVTNVLFADKFNLNYQQLQVKSDTFAYQLKKERQLTAKLS